MPVRLSRAFAAMLCLAANCALAQQQPAPVQAPAPVQTPAPAKQDDYTLHLNTSLVVLDVVVTDKKGNIVRNLKRDDFRVTEAGAPQTILSFDEAGASLPAPDARINSTADLDRLAPAAPVNIILLDEFNTRFEDMAFARYSLKKFLDTQPERLTSPTELIAVSLTRFTVLHDYTQDKKAILDALNHHFVQYPWQVHQGGWVAERYSLAFETLRAVALATEGHPGHKNMIWVGRGFPTIDMTGIPGPDKDTLENIVQSTVNTLRDARVTLYTIDPAGLMVDTGKYGGATMTGNNNFGYEALDLDPFGSNYQFSRLATATGGKALYGRNDVDAMIGTAVRDGSSFYTLSYRPTIASTDQAKFRGIKVMVNQPGLTATTRQGYYPNDKPPVLADASVKENADKRLMGDLLVADTTAMTYDGVQMTVAPAAQAGMYHLRISPQSVHWLTGNGEKYPYADFILLVSSFDRKGKELERKARDLHISSSSSEVAAGGHAVDLNFPFTPNPKAVRAHFVVRFSDSGRIGTQDLPITPATATAAQK